MRLRIHAVALCLFTTGLGDAWSQAPATAAKSQVTGGDTVIQLTEREQREVALMTELATLRQKIAEARANEEIVVLPTLMLTPSRDATKSPAPSTTTPLPPKQPVAPPVAATAETISADQKKIAELERQLAQLTHAEAGSGHPATMTKRATPTTDRYHVLRVGPRNSFVVLDYGADAGAVTGKQLAVTRDGRELARAKISEARPRFALAQILPTSVKGQLQTGDLVVINH